MTSKLDTTIIIDDADETSINLLVNGELTRINRKLDVLQEFLQGLDRKSFQSADKIYNIGTISSANFDFIIEQAKAGESLPTDLSYDLITERNRWIQSLRQELLKRNIAVGNRPLDIIQHFGWLIEEFLRKMLTAEGQQRNQKALSFMTEAWQSSLRYLCYIQLSQILKLEINQRIPVFEEYIKMQAIDLKQDNTYLAEGEFDYLSLLIIATKVLSTSDGFMPEIYPFVQELSNTKGELFEIAMFLSKYRQKVIDNNLPEGIELSKLMDEYLTALISWLRKISFLAQYRLISIKDISLNYRLGTPQNFVHIYGELHGLYNQAYAMGEDYDSKVIEGLYTFNQSVLLFKGNNAAVGLDQIRNPGVYLSLSPFVIDHSVFADQPKQTPEIYYYVGRPKGTRQYSFAHYKNELTYKEALQSSSNKILSVKSENINQPKLNELFEQLENLFAPFK